MRAIIYTNILDPGNNYYVKDIVVGNELKYTQADIDTLENLIAPNTESIHVHL